MVEIYAFLVAAYDLKFAGSFSLAELISFLLILFAALSKKNYKLDFNSLLLLFFMFWLLVSTLDLNSEKYYSSSAFTNNMLRFSIYYLGFITLPKFFLNKERLNNLFKNLMYATIIISIIGIIQFFLIKFNIKAEIRIANILTNKNSSLEIDRITSVFSEPAHLSIYLGMILSLSFTFYKHHPKPKLYKYLVVLVALNLILSTSLTGFLILMYLLFMMFYDTEQTKGKFASKLKNTFILLFVSFIVFIVVLQIDFLNDKIFERFYSVAEMDDGSANQRLFGGFEFASNVLSEHPITGIGLGQAESYYNSQNFVFANYWVGEQEVGGGVNNIFISIFIQSGIIGLLLFILFMINLYKHNKYLLFMCIIICFSWGYFNTPLFWFYFFISKAIQINQLGITHTPISKFKKKQIFI
jgi:O-antigen ligase